MPLAALLVGCGPSGNSFRLKGTINGMSEGEVYIYNTSFDNARFDTLRLDGGKFYYGGTSDYPTPYIIVFPNAYEQVVFIGPGEEIEYEAVSNDLNNYRVSGSDENKQMNEFRSTISNASYSDIQAAARRFINDNPQSAVSLYLCEQYFLKNPQTSYTELLDILDILRPRHTSNNYFLALDAKAKALKTLSEGDAFPDIKMPDKDNRQVRLWSKSTSPYTMFLCWATWIPTSYELLSVVRQQSRQVSKSQMRFVAFSIDNEYERWSNMVRYDSISPIEHYCDTRAFSSPVIHELGTTNIPTYFILDSKHRVVAKGNESTQLTDDIKKYTEK